MIDPTWPTLRDSLARAASESQHVSLSARYLQALLDDLDRMRSQHRCDADVYERIAAVKVGESGVYIGCFVFCPFCLVESSAINATMADLTHKPGCLWSEAAG